MVKEHIQVAVRVRPLTQAEKTAGERKALFCGDKSVRFSLEEVQGHPPTQSPLSKSSVGGKHFEFQNCFDEKATTAAVYAAAVDPLVTAALQGINATVFLYGPTGSGKTHTMTGDYVERAEPGERLSKSPSASRGGLRGDDQRSTFESSIAYKTKETLRRPKVPERTPAPPLIGSRSQVLKSTGTSQGVLQIALHSILGDKRVKGDLKRNLRCSYLEIYNENVFDLLRGPEELTTPLPLSEDPSRSEFLVRGALEATLETFDQAMDVLNQGERNRHFAATRLNHHSSRSHTVFRLFIQTQNTEGASVEAVLNFVDLAGSERISKYDQEEAGLAKSSRIQESKSINKALFFLTSVINAKATSRGDQAHAYRNSALTKILKNSIGGNAKTLIILCLTPTLSAYEQTMSTLRFGNLAKTIENTVQVNRVAAPQEVATGLITKDLVKRCEDRLHQLELAYHQNRETFESYRRKKIELEEQLAFLLRSQAGSPPSKDASVTKKTAHLGSCGALDFFGPRAAQPPLADTTQIAKLAQRSMDSELLAAKQRRIEDLNCKIASLNATLASRDAALAEATRGQQAALAALDFLLGKHRGEAPRLPEHLLEALPQTALTLIQNCKTLQLNSRCVRMGLPEMPLSIPQPVGGAQTPTGEQLAACFAPQLEINYRKADLPQGSQPFGERPVNFLPASETRRSDVIELKAQLPTTSSKENHFCDNLSLSDLFENLSMLTPAVKRGKPISPGFLMGD